MNGGALCRSAPIANAGHKGYALAVMVDVLSAVLSGANWGPFAPPFALRLKIPERSVGKGIGHFFGAMRIDGFMDLDAFKRQIDEYIRVFRATKPAPGTNGPLIPGILNAKGKIAPRKVPLSCPSSKIRDILETGIPSTDSLFLLGPVKCPKHPTCGFTFLF